MAAIPTDTHIGRHVVVIGGSFAGLGAAYTLRERLDPRDKVTVVSKTGYFVFAPSLTWAVLGDVLRHNSFALEPALNAKGIDFVGTHVDRVRVADKRIETGAGEIGYDMLLVATGGRPNPNAVPGLAGEFRSASWIVGEESAMEARNVLHALFEEPGPLVIGAAQGATYLSAVYELALALDEALRKKKIRNRVPMTFVTAEPFLGHLGLGQSAASEQLTRLFAARNIAYEAGVEIDSVGRHEVRVGNGKTLPARAVVIMPPFTGDVDIWKSAGLTDQSGLIPVDEHYRHVDIDTVYAAGVAAYFQEPVIPLGLTRAPHTGYLSTRMGIKAGQNMAAAMGYGSPVRNPLPRFVDVRVIDGGDTGLLLTSRRNGGLHNKAYPLPGRTSHILKSSLERYLIWRLRTGRMDLP